VKDLSTPRSVLYTYAYAYDTMDLDTLADCFTEDAEFSYTIDGGASGGPFTGRAAIAEMNRTTIEAQAGSGSRRHVMTNVFGSVDRDAADLIAYLTLTLTLATGGVQTVVTTGV
jgi:hypothetical protein